MAILIVGLSLKYRQPNEFSRRSGGCGPITVALTFRRRGSIIYIIFYVSVPSPFPDSIHQTDRKRQSFGRRWFSIVCPQKLSRHSFDTIINTSQPANRSTPTDNVTLLVSFDAFLRLVSDW